MTDNVRPNLTRMDRFLRNGSVTDKKDDLHRQTQVFVLEIQSMEEVTTGVYLVSTNRNRYSAVSGGGHAKMVLLYAAMSAAAHQRHRISGIASAHWKRYPQLRFDLEIFLALLTRF